MNSRGGRRRGKACATLSLAVAASYASAQTDCGVPGTITGKVGEQKVQLATRNFPDGSIAVRAPLAVNPDGGVSSYTMGNHGFTYIANGLAKWKNGAREKCDAECTKGLLQAEAAGFVKGTDEFCVFAMDVLPMDTGRSTSECPDGHIVGNGKGQLRKGKIISSVIGEDIQTYVSTTSLRHLVDGSPEYLDSEALPIAVTPTKRLLGQLVWVGGSGLHGTTAVIGDEGPAFGEGSIALHQLLRYGSVIPQKPGPIRQDKRCRGEETAMRPPFVSKPDGGSNDRCAAGRRPVSDSDIRAYSGITESIDFLVLGNAAFRFNPNDRIIRTEVTADSINQIAAKAGYTAEKISQMVACLNR
ncbi:hypothetical protein PQR67_35585 [Paraburkholderia fungorum]|uniref:hypothetical protein n=1 Tax=Paraburkholderia fungorum TaxID=134537 RepID=UPI0038BAC8D3